MGEIRVNYGNVRAQVRKLNRAADQCGEVLRELHQTKEQLRSCWEGQAAEAYQTSMEQQARKLGQMQNDIGRVARTIRRVADEFREAERRLERLMEQG